jgi:hypothetical protein
MKSECKSGDKDPSSFGVERDDVNTSRRTIRSRREGADTRLQRVRVDR